MKRNSLIDLFRFVCAFMVVLIHIKLPGDFANGFFFPLTRMAVPFFFMVSGYFLADENTERMKQRLNKQIRSVFWLFAGAMLALFLVELLIDLAQNPGGTQKYLSVLWDWNNWYRLIAVNNTSRFYAGHLWYLSALLYSMVLIRLALEYHELKKMYWIAVVLGLLLVPLMVLQRINGKVPKELLLNFLFPGLAYVIGGAWIKCSAQRILKWPRKLVVLLPVIFSLLTIGERWLVYAVFGFGSLTTFFNGMLLAASLIVLSIHFPSAGERTPLPKWGAKYSLMIYICHMGFIDILNAVAKSWGFQNAAWYQWSAPFFVFLVSFGFAALWEGTKNKLKERKQAKIAA